jgi:hypothetical protein
MNPDTAADAMTADPTRNEIVVAETRASIRGGFDYSNLAGRFAVEG